MSDMARIRSMILAASVALLGCMSVGAQQVPLSVAFGFWGQGVGHVVYADDLAVQQVGPNLLGDPGFESQLPGGVSSPWIAYFSDGGGAGGVEQSEGIAHSGANDAWIGTNTVHWNCIAQFVNVQPNTDYIYTGWVSSSLHAQNGYFSARNPDGSPIQEINFAGFSGYQNMAVRFNSGLNTSVMLTVGFWGDGIGAEVRSDDLSLLQVGPNLLQDSGFELQPSTGLSAPWVIHDTDGNGASGVDQNAGHAHSGLNDGWVGTSSTHWNETAQYLSLQPKTSYIYSGWIESQLTAMVGYFAVRNPDGSPYQEVNFGGLPAYTLLVVPFTTGAGSGSAPGPGGYPQPTCPTQ